MHTTSSGIVYIIADRPIRGMDENGDLFPSRVLPPDREYATATMFNICVICCSVVDVDLTFNSTSNPLLLIPWPRAQGPQRWPRQVWGNHSPSATRSLVCICKRMYAQAEAWSGIWRTLSSVHRRSASENIESQEAARRPKPSSGCRGRSSTSRSMYDVQACPYH